MRRTAGIAAVLALSASGAAPASGQVLQARLQGTFTVHGKLTTADDVYGEHQGQRVQRIWVFVPQCASGSCRRVLLERQRSGRRILNALMLTRQAPGRYFGRGRFWVPLRCAGRVVGHGGLATETITVWITRTAIVGTTRFATAIGASYDNPSRQNLTDCPGGIGRDAARYRGQLSSSLPGPPTAGFTTSPNPATTSATFIDDSAPGRGGAPIVAWSWNFGDPSSPVDTSTAPDPMHQFSAPGTYTVTLSVRDGYGQTATSSIEVTV